ncbi:uncharacterized protein [Rhodnius prolixus]
MAYLKVILLLSMATCLLAETTLKKRENAADADLQTDSTYGFGYASPYLGGLYGSGYYGGYSRFGWPHSHGYYGYGGYGYPRYGYGHGHYGHYGYPYYGGYYG